jgi:beta-galactosidase
VYTSGDEAELFLNDRSLGRKKRGPNEYRLRWDDVIYEPGTVRVVAYKKGKRWAENVVETAGASTKITLRADRATIHADGRDLSYVTVALVDENGTLTPRAKNRVRFAVSGPGEIVATDNGDATNLESFQAKEKNAFNGLCLVIVRSKPGAAGAITLRAESDGLQGARILFRAVPEA